MNLSKHFSELSKTTQEKQLEHWNSVYANAIFQAEFKELLKHILENRKPNISARYGFSEAKNDLDIYEAYLTYYVNLNKFITRFVPNNETLQELTKSLFSDLLVEIYPFVGDFAKTNPSFYHNGGKSNSYVQFDNTRNLSVTIRIWIAEDQIKIKDRTDLPSKLKNALLEDRASKLEEAKGEHERTKKEKELKEKSFQSETVSQRNFETIKNYTKEVILKHIAETTPTSVVFTSDNQDRGESYQYRNFGRTYHNFTYCIQNLKSTLVKDLKLTFLSKEIYSEILKQMEADIQKEIHLISFYTRVSDNLLYLVFEKDITDELKRIYPIPTHEEDVWK